jgi:hypothetical protein
VLSDAKSGALIAAERPLFSESRAANLRSRRPARSIAADYEKDARLYQECGRLSEFLKALFMASASDAGASSLPPRRFLIRADALRRFD